MSSPYSIYGARLIDKGFCVVPCMPNDKIPADFHNGEWRAMSGWSSKYSANMPSKWQIDSWSKKPDGGICLILGRASQYVVAIDVDVDEAVDDVRRCLPETDVVKRGQKGATFFYRSRTIPSTSFNGTKQDGRIVRLVDVLAEGKQTVLPPTIHPKTGLPYGWTGGYALDEIEPCDLPELPDDALERIRDVLRDHGYDENTMPHSYALNKAAKAGDPRYQNYSDSGPYKQLNEEAWAEPEKWLCALNLFKLQRTRSGNYECVGVWAQSGTGQADEARERNLKINVHRHTIVDFGDGDKGYSPIDLVAAARKCTPAEAFRYLSDILAGYVKIDTSRLKVSNEPEQPEPEPPATIELPPVKTEIVVVEPVRKPVMDITKCPGLIGRMADHITLSARQQQPLFSMGAALAVMGVLTGRAYKGPTGVGTNLYQIMGAGTGKGKQHPFNGIRAILRKCGLIGHLGPGEFASDVAIFSALMNEPNLLCCIDEAAGIMGRSSAKNAAAHETGISAEMRKAYSLNFDVYMTKESAVRKSVPIYWPALGLFMGSTAEELYSRITSSEITNGLLNRFVILRNDERPVRCEPDLDVNEVPLDILEEAKEIYHRSGANAPFHGKGETDPTSTPHIVDWADDEARQAWKAIVERGDSLTDDKSPLYVRCAENTIRVATCRAISNNCQNPAVTAEDLAWAAQYVFTAADAMLVDTEDRIAENLFEADMNKMIGVMKRFGGNICRSDLIRGTKMSSKRLDEVAGALAEGGRVEITDTLQTGSHKARRTYRLLT